MPSAHAHPQKLQHLLVIKKYTLNYSRIPVIIEAWPCRSLLGFIDFVVTPFTSRALSKTCATAAFCCFLRWLSALGGRSL